MPFIKKIVTEDEGLEMLLQDKAPEILYEKYAGGDIRHPGLIPTEWLINEEEDARFCLLDVSTQPSGKNIFLLKIHHDYILCELAEANTVVFLHDSPLFENELYKVKYLIAAVFSIVDFRGISIIERFGMAPDPVFKFSPAVCV